MTRRGIRTGMLGLLFMLGLSTGAMRPARADDPPPPPPEEQPVPEAPTNEELDERLRLLERRDEVTQEQTAEKARTNPTVSAGRDGIRIKSADGSSWIRIGGYIQVDGRFFTEDDERPVTNTWQLRRVRPIFEGSVSNRFDFRIMPDFGLGTTVLQDAYVDWRFGATTRLRAGKTKVPFGLERLQSAQDMLFVEREFVTNISPNRDIGLMLAGDPMDGLLNWSAGIWNGVSDGGSADLDSSNGKDGSARVFVQPFLRTASTAFRGFGLGVAATYGNSEGTPAAPGLPTYRTPGQQTLLTYRTDATPTTAATAAGTTVASGTRKRVSPQLYWSIGRFGLLAEAARSYQEVTRAPSSTNLTADAWDATASFLLTDDVTSFKGVTPKKPFDPDAHTWGAFELVARAGAQREDANAFPFYSNPATSAEVARDRGFGANWYMSRNAKLMLDYIETRFEGGAANGDREDERVLYSRFQVSF